MNLICFFKLPGLQFTAPGVFHMIYIYLTIVTVTAAVAMLKPYLSVMTQ